jgi:hypothetical protein
VDVIGLGARVYEAETRFRDLRGGFREVGKGCGDLPNAFGRLPKPL